MNKKYTDTHSQLGMSLPEGYSGFQVTGIIKRCFWVCIFRFWVFWGLENLARILSYVCFFGYSKQCEVCGSAHVRVGQLCSSLNKVQPKLFSGCVNV